MKNTHITPRDSFKTTTKEAVESQSLEKDILSLLAAAMPLRSDIPGFNREVYGHIMKDRVTNNPVHDMLFYAIYATFSEAMLKLHDSRQAEEAMLNPDLERPSDPGSTSTPSHSELLTVFDKLVQTYAKHFRGDSLGVTPRTDPEDNTNR